MRHLRWERHGRIFAHDDEGQPNTFTLKSRVGELNVDVLGDGSQFAPYVLDADRVRHGDSECDFESGHQVLKRLGQTLVSRSRIFIQRETSPSVWTDVPHGTPTRNVQHDYPTEGNCTAYLDFPDIQGYAQGARFQCGIEVGGGDRAIYGYRMRSPVAGTFRLEWVLDIPESASLEWIDAPTKTMGTVHIGGRVGNVEVRWRVEESDKRSATVETDGDNRILHIFLGPYTLASMEWLTVYPDTWGPTGIGANADDCCESDNTTFYISGPDSDGDKVGGYGYAISWDIGYRFLNVTIPSGATINTAVLDLYNTYRDTANAVDIRIHAEDIDDSTTYSSSARPSQKTPITTAYTDWAFTGPSGARNVWVQSPDCTAVIQEIIDRAGWNSGQDINVLLFDNANADGEACQFNDYNYSSSLDTTLTVTYTAAAGGATVPSLLCLLGVGGPSA